MVDLLARGMAWMDEQFERWARVEIEYFHGGADGPRLAFPASMLEVTREGVDAAGGSITYRNTDFLIRTKHLIVAGRLVTPADASLIVVPFSGIRKRTYEVGKMPDNDSHYHPSDHSDNAWRVHTRMIDEE